MNDEWVTVCGVNGTAEEQGRAMVLVGDEKEVAQDHGCVAAWGPALERTTAEVLDGSDLC